MANTPINVLLFSFVIQCFSSITFSEESYSPYVERSFPSNVYFGDTHLHTNLSLDANANGNKVLGPDEAYRLAKGDTVKAHNGMKVSLRRPLDFIVIADHAFNLGLMMSLDSSDQNLLRTETGKQLHSAYQKIKANPDKSKRIAAIRNFQRGFWNYGVNKAVTEDSYLESVWQQVTAKADRYNEPEIFTAFIGYEWTSPGGSNKYGNLHRVVLFKGNASKANQVLPFSTFDSRNPEDLWRFLEDYEKNTGDRALAIPHNGNVSNGEMFSMTDFQGNPLDKAYAKTRSRWEPLYEVTQYKGDSETHPILSPDDEFSDYETWNSWGGKSMQEIDTLDLIDQKKSEYARSALKFGLNLQAKFGINPFKFGMIGSTDAHTSIAAADENNFWGKLSTSEPQENRLLGPLVKGGKIQNWEMSAAGYAAVWAEKNTREALFNAMMRKETYATTGPRMIVRFFGGWDYNANDAIKPDLARIGYANGVPMGGDLTSGPKGRAPSFLIAAVKDPDGANLDRVQVVKGWQISRRRVT